MNWNELTMSTPNLNVDSAKRQSEFNQAIRTTAETIRKADEAARLLAGDTERTLEQLGQETTRIHTENRKNWLAALKLTTSAESLHASFEPDLKDKISEAETALLKALDGTRKKLKAAGFDPKDSPQWAQNPTAVEAKFEFMVKTSDTVRQATDQLEQARHDHKIWTMRREAIGNWPAIVSNEVQRFTARALNLV